MDFEIQSKLSWKKVLAALLTCLVTGASMLGGVAWVIEAAFGDDFLLSIIASAVGIALVFGICVYFLTQKTSRNLRLFLSAFFGGCLSCGVAIIGLIIVLNLDIDQVIENQFMLGVVRYAVIDVGLLLGFIGYVGLAHKLQWKKVFQILAFIAPITLVLFTICLTVKIEVFLFLAAPLVFVVPSCIVFFTIERPNKEEV